MTSYIDIERLQFTAAIGVLERERRVGARFELSMRLYYDAAAAVASDSIADALNYADITATALSVMATPVQLLEHAAGRLRAALLKQYPAITAGSITLTKLHPPIAAPTPRVSFTLKW